MIEGQKTWSYYTQGRGRERERDESERERQVRQVTAQLNYVDITRQTQMQACMYQREHTCTPDCTSDQSRDYDMRCLLDVCTDSDTYQTKICEHL